MGHNIAAGSYQPLATATLEKLKLWKFQVRKQPFRGVFLEAAICRYFREKLFWKLYEFLKKTSTIMITWSNRLDICKFTKLKKGLIHAYAFSWSFLGNLRSFTENWFSEHLWASTSEFCLVDLYSKNWKLMTMSNGTNEVITKLNNFLWIRTEMLVEVQLSSKMLMKYIFCG